MDFDAKLALCGVRGSTVPTAGEFCTEANAATNADSFTPGPYGLGPAGAVPGDLAVE